ncbi:MAG TPA: hypothetical protein VFP72_10625 [Kineosporiaceae bacterium]|nr:hypothetical protein [Kineosporiaceae bacterium]
MRVISRRAPVVTAAAALLALAACSSGGSSPSRPAGSGATSAGARSGSVGGGTGSPAPGSGSSVSGRPRVFAYYYLWWSRAHWQDSLGSQYPYAASPLPLPARLDQDGCNPAQLYPGVTVTDVPNRLYGQDDPGVIEQDVRAAAGAGLAGFAVNWIGTGAQAQTLDDNQYTPRLQAMVDAVHAVNRSGTPFSLWLSYKASAKVLPVDQIINDLTWFQHTYGSDPAFDRTQSPRITVIWNGSRKYPVSALQAVSSALRGKLRIIGDETQWSADRAPYLDGDAYYWSSQNPYRNPRSFQQLADLARSVRASTGNPDGSAKTFVAPLIPGYNKQLIGGSGCVPRRNGQTLRTVFDGNLAATHPDAWALISWNEITEGTYVTPMQRFGTQDLDMLRSIVSGR